MLKTVVNTMNAAQHRVELPNGGDYRFLIREIRGKESKNLTQVPYNRCQDVSSKMKNDEQF